MQKTKPFKGKSLIHVPNPFWDMWRLGFFFHEMAFGLLSIFLPLYVVGPSLNGTLVDVGILAALALLAAIPSSFFWGYICDKTRRYKRYILLSFLASTAFLYLFSMANTVAMLIILYVIMSVFHVAHEAPKNVLVSELYSHEDWKKTFAFYEGFTETGWLIGLLLGFFMSFYGIGAFSTLLVCSGLNFLAFAISTVLVNDPIIVFERSLVNIEKTVDFAFHGISLASKLLDGASLKERLRRENVSAFCLGLILFSLATSILFTPMPIFVSNMTRAASLPPGVVFVVFVLNSGGGVLGYFSAGRRSTEPKGQANIARVVASRCVLALLLMITMFVELSLYNVLLATIILVLLGFANALFLVYTLSLSMELIPSGKAGLFNVLIGIGAACGSFIGPSLAQSASFGFPFVFIVAGVIFFLAYVAFRVFA